MSTTTTEDASPPQEAPSISSPGLPPVVERLEKKQKMPICVIVVGMAGSGKSSLLSQMQHHANTTMLTALTSTTSIHDNDSSKDKEGNPGEKENDTTSKSENAASSSTTPTTPNTTLPTYCVNLDPATHHLAYDASIDIRDTINYKEVMKQHNLGPNGAIMTSLNLYATKFDQVMGLLEKRAYGSGKNDGTENTAEKKDAAASTDPSPDTTSTDDKINDNQSGNADNDVGMEYILVDTPGQIEAFTWSASGSIISESLASAFPTVLCFVVDTARCASSPNTFMSNMLYACSMFYRTRLPLVIAFNKTDVVPAEFAMEWMKDYDTFQEALDESMESNTNNSSTITSTGFYGSLTRSLSLVLDEFYSNFTHCCGVSAVTGDGMDDFWKAVRKAALEDFSMDYVEDLKNRMEEQQAKQMAMARANVRRMQRDLKQQQKR